MPLRGPDGQRVDLTGLWAPVDSAGPGWNVRQINGCFFLVDVANETAPEYYNRMCEGEIGSDFVITARCVDFAHLVPQPVMGREYFRISFAADGSPQLERCLALDEPATCEDPAVRWAPPT